MVTWQRIPLQGCYIGGRVGTPRASSSGYPLPVRSRDHESSSGRCCSNSRRSVLTLEPNKTQMKKDCKAAPKAAIGESGCSLKASLRCARVSFAGSLRRRFRVGFERKGEAEACLEERRARFAKFGLKLHEMKARWIEFGRFAIERLKERDEGKPETFDFLGFTHRCGKTRSHEWFTIARESIAKRMRSKLAAVKELLRRRRHWDIGSIGRWLSRVI